MRQYNRIIFVAENWHLQSTYGCRNSAGMQFKTSEVEILARGLVVLFPEPLNQKAETVMISNGINMDGFMSTQLTEEDFSEDALVLVMEHSQREKILEKYGHADPENVYVLTELVGDELEIIDPYGGTLQAYGLCYETMRKTILKLVNLLNESEDNNAGDQTLCRGKYKSIKYCSASF